MTPISSEVFLRTQSDERLVRLARRGHPQAFVVIVARYQRELLAFAARSGPPSRAEDVVQQALLNAFVALRNGTEVTHLRGWLYAIVRRGVARGAAQAPIADGNLDAAHTEPLEDVVLRRARARDALAAVSGLPQRQREALLATVFGGVSRSDLARELGQSEGVVRQLVHRARVNVRGAVGAVVPYPVLRWVLVRGEVPASGQSLDLTGSAALVSSGGIAAKLGIVLASGVVATGAFALQGAAPRHRHQGARTAPLAAVTRPARRPATQAVLVAAPRLEVAQATAPRAHDAVAAVHRAPAGALDGRDSPATRADVPAKRSPTDDSPHGSGSSPGGDGADGGSTGPSAPAPRRVTAVAQEASSGHDGSPDGGGSSDGGGSLDGSSSRGGSSTSAGGAGTSPDE